MAIRLAIVLLVGYLLTLVPPASADLLAQNLQQESKSDAGQLSEFNRTNKSFLENGNGPIAVRRMNSSTPGRLWRNAESVPLEQLTKSPCSSLGKLCKFSGVVQQIEELPPNATLPPGKWSAILILAANRNTPLGFISLEILYNGDPEPINAGSNVTFAGYFIGTQEGQNLLGGTVECLVFVTNIIKLRPSLPGR